MAVEKRESITCFALTISEKRELVEVCDKLGIRMSDYMRRLVMDKVKKDNK